MEHADSQHELQEFYSYLRIPLSLEEMENGRSGLNDSEVKKFRTALKANQNLALEVMNLVVKNIQALDHYKVATLCKLFSEVFDYTKPTPYQMSFTIGLFIRSLTMLDRYLYKVVNFVENSDIMLTYPGELKTFKSIDYILEPTKIILSSSVSARNKIRENKNNLALIHKLKIYIQSLEEISLLYRLADNLDIYVLYPQQNLGFLVNIEAVQNNFHLFTLLQGLLHENSVDIGRATSANHEAIAIARGLTKFNLDRNMPDEAVFGFYTWHAAIGSKSTVSTMPPTSHLSGKQSPYTIPEFAGKKVILLSSPLSPTLTWDTSAFRPINQFVTPNIIIKKNLSPTEIQEILGSISSFQASS